MPRISRRLYQNAMVSILNTVGFRVEICDFCKLLATKDNIKSYINVAGKNLPYFGRNGQEAFFWETYVERKRLDRIDREAALYRATGWLGFCYVILDDIFKDQFKTTVKIQDRSFGAKLIKTTKYREHMRNRAPDTYGVVDLPRNLVLQITRDPTDI